MAEATWTPEQLEAIVTKDCNLLVAAAAGAGKTAVLVERIIQKLIDPVNPVDIDRLLVVTFTNAAATEMRERIGEAIAAVLEKRPDDRRIHRQLTLLNKASITTLHSFCLEVIRNHFQEIDLDPGFRIADETEGTLLKLDVLAELFEAYYEEIEAHPDFMQLLETYGGNRDDQAIQDMVLQLYSFIQSSPWPADWLRDQLEKLREVQHDSRDFAKTEWGKTLLDSATMTLRGLEDQMQRAVEIIQATEGLDKYLPAFEQDASFLRQMLKRLAGEDPSTNLWDEVVQGFQSHGFAKLSGAKNADKEKQELVKGIRDEVKGRVKKLRERIFLVDSRKAFEDLGVLHASLQTLSQIVLDFDQLFARKKSDKSLVDFNDLEHFCLQILTEADEGNKVPSPIAKRYKERFVEILVDEYQDSNLVQEMIIQTISREDMGQPNVFMVGDVKQSIYRFRQAKPELFLDKYHRYSLDLGSPLRKIQLYKNFRSRSEVVLGVNFLFRQLMSRQAGELDYTEEEALHPGALFPERDQPGQQLGGEIEVHLLQTVISDKLQKTTGDDLAGVPQELEASKAYAATRGKETEEEPFSDELEEENPEDREDGPLEKEELDRIQGEARIAIRRIQELMKPNQENRGFEVYDKSLKKYRDCQYRDIVILLRTTKHWVEVFQEELSEAGIPAFADIGTGFFHTTEVRFIMSLLRIIDNPLQDIPLLAVLRSPLGGFDTDELALLRLAKPKGALFEALEALAQAKEGKISEETLEKAQRFLNHLKQWRQMASYLATDQLIWQLYSQTGYYGMVGALPAGRQRQANLRILFERARQYEETSLRGLFHFILFVEKLKSSRNDMGSAKILGENDNVVRLMSIHKSKGLEFPVVFVSGCGKKFNLQDAKSSILYHQDLGFGPDVVDPNLRLSYPSLAKQALREKMKTETLSEEMRILYVALTRAREKLILTGAVRHHGKATEKWSNALAEEQKIPSHHVLKGECFLDWIGPALLRHPDCVNLAERAGSPWKSLGTDQMLEDPSRWRVQFWQMEEMAERLSQESEDQPAFLQWLEELSNRSPACRLEIQRNMDWTYPFQKVTQIPAKLSVTEWKRRFDQAIQDPEENITKRPLIHKKPLFLQGKKGMTAAEKGTILHFVMQHMDGKGTQIEAQISNMVEKELLTLEQVESINLDQVTGFFRSPLGQRILASPEVHREVPFNLELSWQALSEQKEADGDLHETILLQGVMDCYFQEGEDLVLVDYKTDDVSVGMKKLILSRYQKQITSYALALEKLTGRKVKERLVYLFSTGEVVAFPREDLRGVIV